jgi:hypothetical protein
MGAGLVHHLFASQAAPLIHLDKWGPAAWHFLHTITFVYPVNPTTEEKTNMTDFFTKVLPSILPCKVCSTHYVSILSNYPIQAQNRESLSKWLVEIHNQVNLSTQKPVFTYEQVCDIYLPAGNDDDKIKKSLLFFSCLSIFLCLVSFVILYILRSS